MKEALKKKVKLIEKEFQKITGKPFLPSPKDLSLLVRWIEMDIPVRLIIEGIKMGWEKRERKRPSIFAFKKDIERIIILNRENIVGSSNEKIDKDKLMAQEIKAFLRNIPNELYYTKEILEKALKTIKSKKNDMEKSAMLEKLESELEEILTEKLLKEGENKDKLLREARRKFRIPRLLRFYY
ncbi:MAG: hypothetical protein ACUVUG_00070 [Candidatus Aminicenantia bacterium]